MMRAIEDGLYDPSMKERLTALQSEKAALGGQAEPVASHDLDVLLHPRLPEFYRRKVEALERVLEGPDRAEAMDLIRSMIERVDLAARGEGRNVERPPLASLGGVECRWLRGRDATFTERLSWRRFKRLGSDRRWFCGRDRITLPRRREAITSQRSRPLA